MPGLPSLFRGRHSCDGVMVSVKNSTACQAVGAVFKSGRRPMRISQSPPYQMSFGMVVLP